MDLKLLTGEQVRAARALTRIDQAELAERCGLSLETIRRIERTHGPVDANIQTLSEIVRAFSDLGVIFDGQDGGGVGVRLVARAGETEAKSFDSGRRTGGGLSTIHRLIYHSGVRFDAPVDVALKEVLEESTLRNEAADVSGALVVCGGRALGLLEGPRGAVFELYGLMAADSRIADPQILESADVPLSSRKWPPMVCAQLHGHHPGPHNLNCTRTICLPEALSAQEAMRIIDSARCDWIEDHSTRTRGNWNELHRTGVLRDDP